jgi:hypothetical protein
VFRDGLCRYKRGSDLRGQQENTASIMILNDILKLRDESELFLELKAALSRGCLGELLLVRGTSSRVLDLPSLTLPFIPSFF